MRKSKTYRNICFSGAVLRKAVEVFSSLLKNSDRKDASHSASIYEDNESRSFDDLNEFYATYARDQRCSLSVSFRLKEFHASFNFSRNTEVAVSLDAQADIDKVFLVLDAAAGSSRLEPPPGLIGKTKQYPYVKFSARVIREAHEAFVKEAGQAVSFITLKTNDDTASWKHPNLEEFLAAYVNSKGAYFHCQGNERVLSLDFTESLDSTDVSVTLTTRSAVEAVFQIFEEHVEESRLPEPKVTPAIFVGHGRDEQWRLLKDHLHDLHNMEVTAYEVGPRAGTSVKDVLEEMLESSSFALLVLTGEDIHNDGTVHARENVIHEIGLFQGCLGFKRAIVLLEDGVEEFSNILGINQIRFGKGNIRECFGDVVATIRREFGEESS